MTDTQQLSKTRVRLTFLDPGQNGDDADDHTQDQVEGDEELVQLALRSL